MSFLEDNPNVYYGDLLSVKPHGKMFDKKSYLAILVGEFYPNEPTVVHSDSKKTIAILHKVLQPLFFIPELRATISGNNASWSTIKEVSEILQLTKLTQYIPYYTLMVEEQLKRNNQGAPNVQCD